MPSSHREQLREFATHSLAMALALLMHLGLLLSVLRPPPPWPLRRNPSVAADGRVLRVELLPRRSSLAIPKIAAASFSFVPPLHLPPKRSAKVIRGMPIAPAVSTATARPAPIQPPAVPYGNSRFARTLDEAQAAGLPRVPGANFVSTAPGIVVAPAPSLKQRIHALGRWANCKNAIFKRRMSDGELLKRGLTPQQMDQAFAAYCTP
ncbi:hypothetical protein ISP15_11850 [Dyella jejuensis]|uniref:Uncharacterized protein n=1 Tax=Dyella jejuensis TaxID=1432009 RepID=A0ABW8JIU6_9GAMM